MMDSAMIDLVLDVGASDGGFAYELRASGYDEEIISFEPLDAPFRSLMAKSKRDSKWNAYQYALGNQSDTVPINISRDDKCSSFLTPLERQTRVYSGAKISSHTVVQMRCLSDLYGTLFETEKRIFLKVDTQGYEGQVLEGAGDILDDMVGIQLELSLIPLFDGGRSYSSLLRELERRQFWPGMIEPVFIDPHTEQTLQVDDVFFKHQVLQSMSESIAKND